MPRRRRSAPPRRYSTEPLRPSTAPASTTATSPRACWILEGRDRQSPPSPKPTCAFPKPWRRLSTAAPQRRLVPELAEPPRHRAARRRDRAAHDDARGLGRHVALLPAGARRQHVLVPGGDVRRRRRQPGARRARARGGGGSAAAGARRRRAGPGADGAGGPRLGRRGRPAGGGEGASGAPRRRPPRDGWYHKCSAAAALAGHGRPPRGVAARAWRRGGRGARARVGSKVGRHDGRWRRRRRRWRDRTRRRRRRSRRSRPSRRRRSPTARRAAGPWPGRAGI